MFKRILSNLGANLFSQSSIVLLQLLGVPIFLNFWGKEVYGEWLILMSIPSYLSLAGSGIGNVAGNKMQMFVVNNKVKEALQIFHSAWISITVISLFAFILVAAITLIFPIIQYLNINHISLFEGNISLVLLFFYVVLSLQTELLISVYRANNTNSRGVYINGIIRLIEALLILVIVALKLNLIFVASAYVLLRGLGLAFMFYDLQKVSWFSMSIRKLNFSLMREEIIPICTFMAFPVANAILIQGMIVLVGVKLGPSAVVSFSLMRTMINSIRQLNSIFFYSFWPEFSSSIATKDFLTARKLHRHAFQIILIISIFFTILFSFMGGTIINLWTGGKITMEYDFFLLMLISAIPNNLWTISSVVLMSINKHEKLAIFYVIVALLSYSITIFLLPIFGLIAVPISLFLTDFCMLYFTLKKSLVIVEDTIQRFSFEVFTKLSFQNYLKKI